MKIIVTGSPTTRPMCEQYEAARWSVNDSGNLRIFDKEHELIAMHPTGTWGHVNGWE